MARYLDSSYVGDPGNETIGFRGMFSLCILGSLYNLAVDPSLGRISDRQGREGLFSGLCR